MSRKTAVNALIVSRTAFGTAAWLFPRSTAKAFGFDTQGNTQLPYLARLIGTRDVILAYGLLTTEGDAQRQWLRISLVNDGADTVAAIAGGIGGYFSKRTTAMATAAALAPMIRGVIALRDSNPTAGQAP
jgi:hypothetical protein